MKNSDIDEKTSVHFASGNLDSGLNLVDLNTRDRHVVLTTADSEELRVQKINKQMAEGIASPSKKSDDTYHGWSKIWGDDVLGQAFDKLYHSLHQERSELKLNGEMMAEQQTSHVPSWEEHAKQGQKQLDKLAEENQKQIKSTIDHTFPKKQSEQKD